ncbi:MAG TPA: hypothetical protein VF171_00665 [Trueperaceae bacterium]
MADINVPQSQTSPRVTHPGFIYGESDPFERAVARLHGLNALLCLIEANEGTNIESVWHFMRCVNDDIHRDLYAMLDESRGTPPSANEKAGQENDNG